MKTLNRLFLPCLMLIALTACEGIAYRDPDECYVGQCLQKDTNWSDCYRECTCGCWKEDSKGYYPNAIIQPQTVVSNQPSR